MRELKPCPFCGGRAELCGIENDKIFFVECMDCDVNSNFETPEEAIAAWNRRAQDKKSELLKRYCETIEDYVSIYDKFPEDLQDIATQAIELLEEEENDCDE